MRDYVHLDDLSRAIELTLAPRAPFDVFNIGSGTAHSVEGVLRLMEDVVGRPIAIHAESSDAAADLPSWVVLDVGKARDVLGWTAQISLREGLERLISRAGAPPETRGTVR